MDLDRKFLLNLSTDDQKKEKNFPATSDKITASKTDAPPSPVKKKGSLLPSKKREHSISFREEKYKGEPHSPTKKLGSETLKSSSLFKSNPEIPHLNVPKQRGPSETLFSKKSFEDMNLHPHLVSCLKSRLEVTKVTKVQESTIPLLLKSQDVLVKSCTGSGKTLAYAIPIIHKLQEINPKIKRSDGVFALVIVPTRELALQCFECFSILTKAFTWIVPGYLIGGEKKKSEKARLRKGINILISTPGRLLDHLEHTACLSLNKIEWLVIDEADKLLEQGFEEAVKKIVSHCHANRHSILLSATLSKGVENLAGISLSNPVHIDIATTTGSSQQEFNDLVLPNNLKQFVVIVPSKLRLTVMSAFIIDNCLKNGFKGLIFMCSQSSVDFHYSLLSSILASILYKKECKCKFFRLHGNMKQQERTEVFSAFRSAREGVLLCTDVAARGLDLPHVDWIMQYSAPTSPEIYVHRVGRTARIGKKGSSLLFLLPSENKFAQLLVQQKIQFEEMDENKILQSLLLTGDILMQKSKFTAEECATALQTCFEKEVYSNEVLHQSAKDAFSSYVQSYASYPRLMRHILPFRALHLGHVAKSFCLRESPSALGCSIPKITQSFERKTFKQKQQMRKHHTAVSEYDTGFSAMEQKIGIKRKQHMTVSEYDSGLAALKPNINMNTKRRKHQ